MRGGSCRVPRTRTSASTPTIHPAVRACALPRLSTPGTRTSRRKKSKELQRQLRTGATWTDKHDETRTLTLADILIVAPYNAQVSALLERLPAGSRVGTVDKFQGQQAAIVLYSMATSTPEDAPRGMEFLYSLNRLSVAVSRAQCVAVLVASPALFQVQCKTPRQIELANAFCRYLEMTQAV